MEDNQNQNSKRKFFLLGFIVIVLLIGISAGIYWYVQASRFVSTDNAYTAVESAQITPSVSGTVSEILVNDTQSVKSGDVLVKLDKIDAKLAVDEAKANLERANAALIMANADYDKASIELSRRTGIVESGSVSKDELTRAQNAVISTKASIDIAKSNIELAKTKLNQAEVDLNRTTIIAPVGGIVAKRQVQLGQRVQVGTPLLSIVPINQIHVDANFKEGQLEKVKVGQKAILHADIYGKHVVYHGIVEGFSGGSGAAFAVIPAQNATGNWIKVVQRVPVRIKLDENELKANPLKVGLSMSVEIDTSTN